MIKDLFEYKDILDCNEEYTIYGKCKMLRDFGNAKAGDEFELIAVVTEENKIEFFSSDEQEEPDFTHLYTLAYVKNS